MTFDCQSKAHSKRAIATSDTAKARAVCDSEAGTERSRRNSCIPHSPNSSFVLRTGASDEGACARKGRGRELQEGGGNRNANDGA